MWYKLFGWFYRWQACKMTATVFANRAHQPDDALMPMMWSSTVFFEAYMTYGAAGTVDDFGPKEPVNLQEVRTNVGSS